MAFVSKVLAEGQLPNTKTTLYTVPASTTAYIKVIQCWNSGGSVETIQIYMKPGSTSRTIGYALVDADASYDPCIHEGGPRTFILQAGDLIEGQTTTATTVDYVIMGIEEA
jgi:hypothetical protein